MKDRHDFNRNRRIADWNRIISTCNLIARVLNNVVSSILNGGRQKIGTVTKAIGQALLNEIGELNSKTVIIHLLMSMKNLERYHLCSILLEMSVRSTRILSSSLVDLTASAEE